VREKPTEEDANTLTCLGNNVDDKRVEGEILAYNNSQINVGVLLRDWNAVYEVIA
jgi:hypothetical protein